MISDKQVFPPAPAQQWNNATHSYDSIPSLVGTNCGVHLYLRKYSSYTPPSFANVVIRSEAGTHRFTVSEDAPIVDHWTVSGYFEGEQGCTYKTMEVEFAHFVLTPTELLPANAMITVEGLAELGVVQEALRFQTSAATDASCGLAGLAGALCGDCPPGHSGSTATAAGEAGGCSVAGAGALPSMLLVLLPLALAARRRHRSVR